MFEGSPDREWVEGEERLNKMVFIGKDLEMDLLREGFEDCLSDDSAQLAAATQQESVASH